MKKVFSLMFKLFAWTIVALFGAICSLVLIIGVIEGDLSKGLLYYLQ